MKNIRIFISENFEFLAVKFTICLNRRVFVMPQYTSVQSDKSNKYNIKKSAFYVSCSSVYKSK